ncbi:glycosyltransferase family 28 C-terminal domain-containing protein [Besnoitia besnoiti]|uniref:UDP-N-acetylglucosamine transferase subunit ALG13 n=1 Tax=Besnoitia besnoiti TaxID=94643 RepID=A0A2A9MET1_BESBE|nr:glycosyltransferase family 28 C-terminal domain-containing protein [Besnoitia besnoiti]PFH34456.1 glycosyltransferase family 28 C-terminal domain-containing protein [Besnoitia besnoiti]
MTDFSLIEAKRVASPDSRLSSHLDCCSLHSSPCPPQSTTASVTPPLSNISSSSSHPSSASSSSSSLPVSPPASSVSVPSAQFTPDRVLVTVGTTRFDELIAAVLEPRFLLLLLSFGCQQLVLQIGRGERPSFPGIPSSVPFRLSSQSPSLTPRSSAPSTLPDAASLSRRGAARGGERGGDKHVAAELRCCREADALPSCFCSGSCVMEGLTACISADNDSGSFRISQSCLLSLLQQESDLHHPAGRGTGLSAPSSGILPPALGAAPRTLSVSYFRFRPCLDAELEAASLVISHCGAGTVFQALRRGKRLVAVVNASLMNNHQLELGCELARRSHCLLVASLSSEHQRSPGLQAAPAHSLALPSGFAWLWGWVRCAGEEKRDRHHKKEGEQRCELQTAVYKICGATWACAPAEGAASPSREETEKRAREGETAQESGGGAFSGLAALLQPIRSEGGRNGEAEERRGGREEQNEQRRQRACSSSATADREGTDEARQEPGDSQKPLRLVPLPPADLRGFYAAVEAVAGLHPLYGDRRDR